MKKCALKKKQLSVYRRCLKNTAILVYKIKRNMTPKYVAELFCEHHVQYDMRDNDRMSLPNYIILSHLGRIVSVTWGQNFGIISQWR